MISPYALPGIEEYTPKPKNLTIESLPVILKIVEEVTEIPCKKIIEKNRLTEIVYARYLFIGISSEITDCKKEQIMDFISRHRTSFAHSSTTLKDLLETDSTLMRQYKNIMKRLFHLYDN